MNSNRKNNNKRKPKNTQRVVRINKADNALRLRAEYRDQPITQFKLTGIPVILITSVTSGNIIQNISLNTTTLIQTFAARFIAFTECRLVKVKVVVKNFSSTNPGIASMWFSEDDPVAPGVSSTLDARSTQFNFSEIRQKEISLTYVPHDPAQQTWTLTAGTQPIIGYFKLYSNAAQFGTPIAVTNMAILTFLCTVQFRGLI